MITAHLVEKVMTVIVTALQGQAIHHQTTRVTQLLLNTAPLMWSDPQTFS